MIEQFVSEQEARVLRASPLAAHLEAFAAELVKAGYKRFTEQIRLRVLKEQALAKTSALGLKPGRFRADDDLVAFLEAL